MVQKFNTYGTLSGKPSTLLNTFLNAFNSFHKDAEIQFDPEVWNEEDEDGTCLLNPAMILIPGASHPTDREESQAIFALNQLLTNEAPMAFRYLGIHTDLEHEDFLEIPDIRDGEEEFIDAVKNLINHLLFLGL